jgi:hypothetical protein
MELAVQRLSRDFALIGLGMPNNRKGEGSFALAFRNGGVVNAPIMALMGNTSGTPDEKRWGGPVTVADANPSHAYNDTTIKGTWNAGIPGGGAYLGPELYYAWGVPTNVKAIVSPDREAAVSAGEAIAMELVSSTGTMTNLQNFRYDERTIALVANEPRNPASWVVFPTLRLPLLVTDITGDRFIADVAPGASPMSGTTLMELDEVHLVQVARLYTANGELMRVVFGDYTTSTGDLLPLTTGIVGLQFTYNPVSRLLTVYIAARGGERNPAGPSPQPPAWPAWLPPIEPEDLHYRVLVRSLTWRIRN